MRKSMLLILLLGLFGCSVSPLQEEQPIYSGHTSRSAVQLNKCMSPKWQELHPQVISIGTETGYRIPTADDLFGVFSTAIIQDDTEGETDVKVYTANKDIGDPWDKTVRSCI